MKILKIPVFLIFLFLFASFIILKGQATFCSTYSNSSYTYTVGVGTSYSTSSQLGTLPAGAYVYVSGDFTVNSDFTLTNAIVKVANGKKITVISPYAYDDQFVTFTLNNTKLFSPCSGLWKGIEMTDATNLITNTNTQIEDAEIAVNTSNSLFVYLQLSTTIFNRNKIGINLENNYSYSWGEPALYYFTNNKFTCTTPLNGTSNDYTDIGVKLKNIYYPFSYNYGNSNNEFRDIDNGMFIEGNGYTSMAIGYYRFINIKEKCITFLNGSYLDVHNSDFDNIETYGIDFKDSRTLSAQNNVFSLFTRTIEYYGRNMIKISSPKLDNLATISNNIFLFEGKLRSLSIGILLDSRLGETEIIKANINGNGFRQFNDFPTQTDLSIVYSIGIMLQGNYAYSSAVNIENNPFILNANNTGELVGNKGIVADYGNKNKIKVIGNHYTSGHGEFCYFGGSTGIGNEFTNNHAVEGSFPHLGSFLAVDNFENLKVCSNVDNNASVVTFFFLKQCNNTNFSNNTTYGRYQHSLWITQNGTIGTQDQKGNNWYSGNDQFGNLNHPFLQHNDPLLARLSQFSVHTNQSVLNGNNYSFFSEYFPALITPNNGDFFSMQTGTPSTGCITQGAQRDEADQSAQRVITDMEDIDPIVDIAIADGSYGRLMRNPVIGFDGQLHLQRKLKRNGGLANTHPSLTSFSHAHEFSNIGKLAKLEQDMDDVQDIDDVKKNKIDVLRKKSQEIEKQMKQYNANRKPTKAEAKQENKQRLDLDMAIEDLYTEHKDNKKLKLRTVKSDADNIAPTTTYERYAKEVHQIYLDAQLNTEGQFTASQTATLKKIAGTCVTEGGKIVYVARGYLPESDLQEVLKLVETCEKRPEVSQVNLSVQPEAQLQATSKVVSNIVSLYPNPTNDAFYIDIPKGLTGDIDVYDVTGRLVKSSKLVTGSNFIKHEISEGIYFARINTSDGMTKSIKFTVKH